MSTYTSFRVSVLEVKLTELQGKIDELTKRLESSEESLNEYQIGTDKAAD